MRCLFTMFAEDVGFLPDGVFAKAPKDFWLPHPESFPGGVENLWRTMNEGGEMFGVVGKILRFNGPYGESQGATFAQPRDGLYDCLRRQRPKHRQRSATSAVGTT